MIATKGGRLLLEERRRKILDLVARDGRITVKTIVQQFGVSSVTARADLDTLADMGALIRSHGGAVSQLDPVQDYPVRFKETLHHPEAGPTTQDILEAQLNSFMIRVSREVTIVADASKIGRRGLSPIGSLSCIRRLITDDRIDPEVTRLLESKGMELIVV